VSGGQLKTSVKRADVIGDGSLRESSCYGDLGVGFAEAEVVGDEVALGGGGFVVVGEELAEGAEAFVAVEVLGGGADGDGLDVHLLGDLGVGSALQEPLADVVAARGGVDLGAVGWV